MLGLEVRFQNVRVCRETRTPSGRSGLPCSSPKRRGTDSGWWRDVRTKYEVWTTDDSSEATFVLRSSFKIDKERQTIKKSAGSDDGSNS